LFIATCLVFTTAKALYFNLSYNNTFTSNRTTAAAAETTTTAAITAAAITAMAAEPKSKHTNTCLKI